MSISGMYTRARKRGEAAGPPSITAVAFPVRTRKPMPADSPRAPLLVACRVFRLRTDVGTKDPADERSVCLRNSRTGAHGLYRPERAGASALRFLDGRPHDV